MDLSNQGLFKLPPEARAKALANMGMTEEDYTEKLTRQLQRDDSTGHGWSDKAENPGWSDDKPTGEVLPER